MQHAEILAAVRIHVQQAFTELGADLHDGITETILIRHEHYCGRRFLASGLQAIWFVEEEEIKLYAKDGKVIRVSPVREALQDTATTRRQAA